jgi:methylenetetrahydrofolate reductase (NADPH)
MTFRTDLGKKFVFTGEIEPGKITDLSGVVDEARKLRGCVSAVNVTDNPQSNAYISSLVCSHVIQAEAGVEAIYQLTCRDRNRIALTSDLLGAAALGIKNVLAITGDYTTLGDMPEARPVFDLDACRLVHMIKKMNEGFDLGGHPISPKTDFFVGVAANPNSVPLEPEVIKLRKKKEAGAQFAQTQVIFDIETVERFLEAAKGIEIPILIGIFPLKSYGVADYFDKHIPGVKVPAELLGEFREIKKSSEDRVVLRKAYDEANVRFFSSLIKDIKKSGAAGCHVMAVSYAEMAVKLIKG